MGVGRAEAQAGPSLRLFAATDEVTAYRYGRVVPLALGVYAAPTGDAFEVRATRADYDQPITAAQVDAATGDVLWSIPSDRIAGWRGLARFFTLSIKNADGDGVVWRRLPFCAAGERQRVDDSGPPLPVYPQFCGWGSPFTRGMVWGLEEGWAVAIAGNFDEGPELYVRIPPGRYTATVKIARYWATALGIDPADAIATVVLRVRDVRCECDAVAAASGEDLESFAPSSVPPDLEDPDPSVLPDLAALPAWNVRMNRIREREYMAFAASPWNAGPAPMVVEGFRREGEALMDAFQYFYDADGAVVGRAAVGAMEYDTRRGHRHWHFLQFARFSLLDAGSNEVVRSTKQAFCLYPTDPIDLTLPGAVWNPWNVRLTTQCGGESALWVREVLDAGWADTYYQWVPGQSLNVTGVPNGWYRIRIEVNPAGVLHERSTANNVEDRLVYLYGRPGDRHVASAPWHGIDP